MASAPDGTAYLPPRICDWGVGVAVTADNGVTWKLHKLDGSRADANAKDPSIGLAADGTAYLAWGMPDGEDTVPVVSVGKSRGEQWGAARRLGREYGIRNVKFPAVVAGDGNRAAVAFLGTSTGGKDQKNSFEGVWRLYVAFTYDGGRTWKTVNATPNSPIQVGSICTSGVLCTGNTRNLLDFNDVVIDGKGRVLAGVADGCFDVECGKNERGKRGLIVRQTAGRGLLRKYDKELAGR